MDFFIRDDIYEAGRDMEDGQPIYGKLFYVMARNERGEQWAHNAHFRDTTVRVHDDEECGPIQLADRKTAEAEASANRVLERIKAGGGVLDMSYWIETDPAYGSTAYQEIDAVGGHRYAELRAAEDSGEIAFGMADRLFMA